MKDVGPRDDCGCCFSGCSSSSSEDSLDSMSSSDESESSLSESLSGSLIADGV